MHCYEQLLTVAFDENDTRNTLGVTGMTTLLTAMILLRKEDNAIAHDNRGWIFAIDNILSVLLYRDVFTHYRTNLVGELQLSFTLELDATKTIRDLEQRSVLTHIKRAIVKGYNGIPSLTSEEEAPEIFPKDIVLRDKTLLSNWYDMGCLRIPKRVHLTFGICVDDTQRVYRNKPQLLFQIIAHNLSKHILDRRSFSPMFQNYARNKSVGFRLLEAKPSELKVYLYDNYIPSLPLEGIHAPDTMRTNTQTPYTEMNESFHILSNYDNTQHGNFTATDVQRELVKAFQKEELLLGTEEYVSKIIERNMVGLLLLKYININIT
ncbi:hypothetical protein RFI_16872 [Reticulomyxa filosa]|uniref:Uncharacterized protein n=1 Tax=Reticulomyxa filosa TaxID=46433 RepID=X6N251_RETFI|nr:hypothetical protein RFI_16872 [Reticulomyxa filosa]|eukprot:ETO20345.1 hypothetical protein RFI_16872 [Reticulomyxa filosa]